MSNELTAAQKYAQVAASFETNTPPNLVPVTKKGQFNILSQQDAAKFEGTVTIFVSKQNNTIVIGQNNEMLLIDDFAQGFKAGRINVDINAATLKHGRLNPTIKQLLSSAVGKEGHPNKAQVNASPDAESLLQTAYKENQAQGRNSQPREVVAEIEVKKEEKGKPAHEAKSEVEQTKQDKQVHEVKAVAKAKKTELKEKKPKYAAGSLGELLAAKGKEDTLAKLENIKEAPKADSKKDVAKTEGSVGATAMTVQAKKIETGKPAIGLSEEEIKEIRREITDMKGRITTLEALLEGASKVSGATVANKGKAVEKTIEAPAHAYAK